jgi:O-methyltransferase
MPIVRALLNSKGSRRALLWAAYRAELLAFQEANASVESVPGTVYRDRKAFYKRLFEVARLDGPIDYLEFGVYKGDSIAWWANANTDPASRFVGFDSFEGLPETVNQHWSKGRFSVDRAVPAIADPRVGFEVGWFNQTVPPFMKGFVRGERMLVNLDADIYSSTIVALAHLAPHLARGDVVIFDEFADTVNEWRAYCDFNAMFDLKIRPMLQQRDWMSVAFEVL